MTETKDETEDVSKEIEMNLFQQVWTLEGVLIGQQRHLIDQMEKFIPERGSDEWNKLMKDVNDTLAELRAINEMIKQMRAERGEEGDHDNRRDRPSRFESDTELPKN